MKNRYVSFEVSDRIKKRLKELGTTAEQMLLELEMGKRTLQNYKTSMPKADNLAYIADYLGCSVDYLLGRTSDPKTTYENIQSSNIVNVNGNNGDHSPLTVNKASDEDKELLELIQGLSLKQKAKVITYIYETIEAEK